MEGTINSTLFSVSCNFSIFIFLKSNVSTWKIYSLIIKKNYFLTELLAVKGLHYSFCTLSFSLENCMKILWHLVTLSLLKFNPRETSCNYLIENHYLSSFSQDSEFCT